MMEIVKNMIKSLLFQPLVRNCKIYLATVVVIILTIVMVVNAKNLTFLDKLLAQMIKDNIIEIPAIFKFTNKYYYLSGLIPAITFVLLAIVLFLSQKDKKFKYQLIILYSALFLLYFGISYTIEISLKQTLNRPRPYQTTLFSNDTKIECKVEFLPFGQYNKNYGNPCNYHLYSCPSGHTQTVTTTITGSIFMVNFVIKQLNQQPKKNIIIVCVLYTYYYLLLILAIILIPVTAIGRILVSAHFFSDVSLGFVLSFSLAGVWELFGLKPAEQHQQLLEES